MSEEKIRYQDLKLEKVSIEGYRVGGAFYTTEESAKYAACTHRPCESCGADARKSRVYCDECSIKLDVARWEKAGKLPHDKGEGFFYSDFLDEYFSSIDEADERCEEDGLDIKDLLLYHCRRENPPQVDLDDLYGDITPEESDPSEMYTNEILIACDSLNKLIREHPVNSFVPSKIAVELPDATKEAEIEVNTYE